MHDFDTGDHQFQGALQSSSDGNSLSFLSEQGRVEVESLRKSDGKIASDVANKADVGEDL
jgi:hypothetical protein